MAYVYTFFLLPMLVIFAFSAIVGAIMFCVDIIKWSKRPEKFTTVSDDLNTINSNDSEMKSINIDDIL